MVHIPSAEIGPGWTLRTTAGSERSGYLPVTQGSREFPFKWRIVKQFLENYRCPAIDPNVSLTIVNDEVGCLAHCSSSPGRGIEEKIKTLVETRWAMRPNAWHRREHQQGCRRASGWYWPSWRAGWAGGVACSSSVILALVSVCGAQEPAAQLAAVPLHQRIDLLIEEHLRSLPGPDRKPAAAATDGEFLRRVWLDLAGMIPPA